MEYAKDWKTENGACTLEDMSNNILVLEKLVPVFIQFFVHAFSSSSRFRNNLTFYCNFSFEIIFVSFQRCYLKFSVSVSI